MVVMAVMMVGKNKPVPGGPSKRTAFGRLVVEEEGFFLVP